MIDMHSLYPGISTCVQLEIVVAFDGRKYVIVRLNVIILTHAKYMEISHVFIHFIAKKAQFLSIYLIIAWKRLSA